VIQNNIKEQVTADILQMKYVWFFI